MINYLGYINEGQKQGVSRKDIVQEAYERFVAIYDNPSSKDNEQENYYSTNPLIIELAKRYMKVGVPEFVTREWCILYFMYSQDRTWWSQTFNDIYFGDRRHTFENVDGFYKQLKNRIKVEALNTIKEKLNDSSFYIDLKEFIEDSELQHRMTHKYEFGKVTTYCYMFLKKALDELKPDWANRGTKANLWDMSLKEASRTVYFQQVALDRIKDFSVEEIFNYVINKLINANNERRVDYLLSKRDDTVHNGQMPRYKANKGEFINYRIPEKTIKMHRSNDNGDPDTFTNVGSIYLAGKHPDPNNHTWNDLEFNVDDIYIKAQRRSEEYVKSNTELSSNISISDEFYNKIENVFDMLEHWINYIDILNNPNKAVEYLIRHKDYYNITDEWIEDNIHYVRGTKTGLFDMVKENIANDLRTPDFNIIFSSILKYLMENDCYIMYKEFKPGYSMYQTLSSVEKDELPGYTFQFTDYSDSQLHSAPINRYDIMTIDAEYEITEDNPELYNIYGDVFIALSKLCNGNAFELFEEVDDRIKGILFKYIVKNREVYTVGEKWIRDNIHYVRADNSGLLNLKESSNFEANDLLDMTIQYCIDNNLAFKEIQAFDYRTIDENKLDVWAENGGIEFYNSEYPKLRVSVENGILKTFPNLDYPIVFENTLKSTKTYEIPKDIFRSFCNKISYLYKYVFDSYWIEYIESKDDIEKLKIIKYLKKFNMLSVPIEIEYQNLSRADNSGLLNLKEKKIDFQNFVSESKYIKLFEEYKYQNILPENFLTDCKPFIDEMKKCAEFFNYSPSDFQSFFYRGIKHATQKDFYENPIVPLPYAENEFHCYKINHNWDRKPVDTPTDIHNAFNVQFKEKFGWNVRSGIFTTRHIDNANAYGVVFIIVPIGKFEYCWSPKYKDFFGELEGDLYAKYSSYSEYLDYAHMMWEDEYGHYGWGGGSGKGQWVYKPTGVYTHTKNLPNAVDFIKSKFPELVSDSIYEYPFSTHLFDWQSDVSFDDYKLSEEKWQEQKDQGIKDIVNRYITNDLCNTGDCEVSFKCDSYYAFAIDSSQIIRPRPEEITGTPNYTKILKDIIWGE